jgi:hypothetical protein
VANVSIISDNYEHYKCDIRVRKCLSILVLKNCIFFFRAALEVKSKMYEKLSQDSSAIDDDTRFLVNFQQKSLDEHNKAGETSNTKEPEEEEEHFSDEDDGPLDPEEDWYAVGYLWEGVFNKNYNVAH